ncbi:hypothetical protein PIB30_075571 [Stylosanthes scabra]|uniref:Protein kinase domain-containing protein n=1 Tax=Stylosanthes scabra TaxID=79078 RepID=A0ABU6SQ71_9FABA|nr:hypothetical protein [Stylosanthes scabra]
MAYLRSRLKNGIVSICMLVMSLGCVKSNNGEGEYMLKLLNALQPTPSNWSKSTHMCHWTGVFCNNQTGRIEQIDLRHMSLRGTVPSGLNDSLIQLKYLYLHNNYLSGPVPTLANLTFLQEVILDNNNFNSIPRGCFHALASLSILSLTNNTNLPPWNFPIDLTAHSSHLQQLYLEATNLMGSLPNISYSFPTIQILYVSNNHLSSIPGGCFHNLINLIDLSLANNTNLPPWAFPLRFTQKLYSLYLDATNLMGSLPNLSHFFPDLIIISLSNNNLTSIPQGCFQELNLVSTNVVGSLPSQIFDSLTSLQTLLLSNNSLTGGLPQSFGGSKIATLHLNNQKGSGFSGPIDILSNMLDLTQVWLQWNSFTGPIPDMSRCTSLQDLQLGHNQLTGVVPNIVLLYLDDFYLGYNFFQGPVPNITFSEVNLGVDTTNGFCHKDPGPCDNKVTILLEIAAEFNYPILLARTWKGNDACKNWSFITCDDKSKIRMVNLSNLNLTGTISPAFANLTDLLELYLNGNNLTGEIPDGLTSLPQLELVNVSNNHLAGNIPKFSPKVKVFTAGNDFLQLPSNGTSGHRQPSRISTPLITGMIAIAVKVLTESSASGEDFINEIASISRTSHVNIVSLLGFCYEKYKRALIYEFMPNGSLDKFIYKQESPNAFCNLDWSTLFQITIGIARGLEYLHRGCNTRILHLDIKPQNILLDEDFCPKIADFGLAKMCKKKESIVSIPSTRGTPGYIAPEVFSRTFGKVSHKSDVYSFGMLILELVGGRKNYDTGESLTSEMYFPDWIYRDLEEQNMLGRGLAATEEENDMIKKITLVSLWCIQTSPSDRPSINEVVEMLEGPLESVPYPPKLVLYAPQMSMSQFSRISYSITDEEDSDEIVEEAVSIK